VASLDETQIQVLARDLMPGLLRILGLESLGLESLGLESLGLES
jgi:hypothetical protein